MHLLCKRIRQRFLGVGGLLFISCVSAGAAILFETDDWNANLIDVTATGGAIAQGNRQGSTELILSQARRPNAGAKICHDAAVLLFNQKDYDEAVDMAQRAVKADPRFAPAHYMQGTTLLAMGRDEASREALLDALRIDPDYPEALSNLGVAQYRLGNNQLALLSLILALEKKVTYPDAWRNYLTVLAKEMVPTQADLTTLPEPPAGDKNAASAWHWQKAVDAMNANKSELSMRHFLRSLSLDLNNPNAHNDIAILLERSGRSALALPFIRAAGVLSPDSKLVQGNLERLSGEVNKQFLEMQVENLKGKLKQQDNAEDREELAETYHRLKRDDDAVEQLQIAVKLAPDEIEYHIKLAQSLARTEQFEEGLLALQPVLRMDPKNPRWRFRAAWLLLRQPEPTRQTRKLTVKFAQEACEFTQYKRKDCIELLAKALDATGETVAANALRETASTLK